MTEKITDREELKSILWDDHLLYDTVATIETGHGRCLRHMETVLKRRTDGKLFIMYWQQGVTGDQDHEYTYEAVEAEAYDVTITKYRVKRAQPEQH